MYGPTWSSRLQRAGVDSLTKLLLIANMLSNTVTNISPNTVVDMYLDTGCGVSSSFQLVCRQQIVSVDACILNTCQLSERDRRSYPLTCTLDGQTLPHHQMSEITRQWPVARVPDANWHNKACIWRGRISGHRALPGDFAHRALGQLDGLPVHCAC